MGEYIDMYYADDDSRVTEDDNYNNPVEFHLRIDEEEEKEVRLYLQTEEGYTAYNLSVSPEGDTDDKWALAPDDNEEADEYNSYGSSLLLDSIDKDEGKVYFWAKAKVSSDEDIEKDRSVDLKVVGTVEPA